MSWDLSFAESDNFGFATSLSIETVPILPSEGNKNIFVHFQLLWPRKKSKDAFATWKDWATCHKNDNFACDFKLGNINNNNPKDDDASHVEFEGVTWK